MKASATEGTSIDGLGEKKPLTFYEVVSSTFAAAIGVQSKANKKRDFNQGKPLQFIIAGLIFATVFVLGVAAIVRAVLSFAV